MDLQKEYPALVEGLCVQAKKFYQLRYQMSNGGNLSARIPGKEQMIVKGTDVSFEQVSPETLSLCDFAGNLLEGNVRPSKEALLHGALYAQFPHVAAIMHCHSPWATAYAEKHETLAFSTYHAALKLKGGCPVFDTKSYIVPQSFFPELLQEISAKDDLNAFLLRGHGQVTLGKDIYHAAMLAELVEETAQIALLAAQS